MSQSHTPVTPEIAEYIENLFSAETDFLRNLRQQANELGFPKINIMPSQAQVLQFLLKSIKAKHVLEIGSLYGYSAFSMAQALPKDGSLQCIESNVDYVKYINGKIEESNVLCEFKVHYGKALEVIPKLRSHTFCAVFIDADKANYQLYAQSVLPLLRSGGLLIADNTLAWGEIGNVTEHSPKLVQELHKFNTYISTNQNLTSILLPLGDGMTIAIKR